MIDPTTGNVGEWQGVYRHGELQEEYRLLDSLPMPIRRAIKDAPYDYSVSDIANIYSRSGTEFDWDTMSYRPASPVNFAREMVSNFQKDVLKNSQTGAEYNGRYWFKTHSGAKLTQRHRRAILRTAHLLPTPKSLT